MSTGRCSTSLLYPGTFGAELFLELAQESDICVAPLVDALVVVAHRENRSVPVRVLVSTRPPGDVGDHLVLPGVDVLVLVDEHMLESRE